MVTDAEAHAEEDQKFRELVEVRNQADALVHATEKSLEDLGEKVEPDERAGIESAAGELKEALKGDDRDVIETKTKALAEASASLAQRVYEEQAGTGQAGDDAPTTPEDDSVVDAEFEEVKDDSDKS
jgi:molecular chaperone DnaK